jgi:thioredoxin-related protein
MNGMRKMTVIILMAAVLLVVTTIVCCIHVRGQILDGPGMEREVTEQPTKSLKKVYNEEINPIEQIDQAVAKAKAEGKFVVCQVGGNWCPWCLKFADFIANDTAISKVIDENFEYIHVNYNPRKSQGPEQVEQGKALMKRLDNAGRFGFPVFVILNEEGKILHIQDSSFLEEGEGYNQEKVLRFFKNWTPSAVKG